MLVCLVLVSCKLLTGLQKWAVNRNRVRYSGTLSGGLLIEAFVVSAMNFFLVEKELATQICSEPDRAPCEMLLLPWVGGIALIPAMNSIASSGFLMKKKDAIHEYLLKIRLESCPQVASSQGTEKQVLR